MSVSVGQLRDVAGAVELEWPVVASLLRGIADTWSGGSGPWERAEDVAVGVSFTDLAGIGDFWIREGRGYRYFGVDGGGGDLWAAAQVNKYAPFKELKE